MALRSFMPRNASILFCAILFLFFYVTRLRDDGEDVALRASSPRSAGGAVSAVAAAAAASVHRRAEAGCDASVVADLRTQVASLKRDLRRLNCEVKGVGPTGGFCLKPGSDGHVGGNGEISHGFATLLSEILAGAHVVDLGAGLGQYEKYWSTFGHNDELKPASMRPASVHACDGAENIEDFANKDADGKPFVVFCDLTSPVDLGGPPSDWAMSIEVGEHIAAGAHEKAYLDNLERHGRVGIVVSWAKPDQPGHFHINGKNEEDVVALFAARGYALDAELTKKLRESSTLGWLQRTTFLFRKTTQ